MVRHLIGIADKSSSLTRVEFVAVREAREYVAEAGRSGPKAKAKSKAKKSAGKSKAAAAKPVEKDIESEEGK